MRSGLEKMDFSGLLKGYAPYDGVCAALGKKITPISISGITEPAQAQLIFGLCSERGVGGLVLCYSDTDARAMYTDISFYTDKSCFFPSREYVFYNNIETRAHENEHMRLDALARASVDSQTIICASVDAALCYTVKKEIFDRDMLYIKTGESYNVEKLCAQLTEMGYVRETAVEGRGQYSLRGGILDIFSPAAGDPVRLEFFDDEVDSVRSFDAETQRTLDMLDGCRIIPCTELIIDAKTREDLINIINERKKKALRRKGELAEFIAAADQDTEKLKNGITFPSADKYAELVYGQIPTVAEYTRGGLTFIVDSARISERGRALEWEHSERISELKLKNVLPSDKQEYWCAYAKLCARLKEGTVIALDVISYSETDFKFSYNTAFETKTGVSFHGKIEYLCDDLAEWRKRGYTVVIPAGSEAKEKNLYGVLTERGIECNISYNGEFAENAVTIVRGGVGKGFEYPSMRFALVCDREIFENKERRARRRIENTKRIKTYNDIEAGDYVVHRAHGIGVYSGIKRITAAGVTREYLQINYRGTDTLYVPVDQLDMLYKYTGTGENAVKLNTLGGSDWHKTRARVKRSTDDMAKKLVELYAQRYASTGYAFSPDTVWQRDFEDTFEYHETEDQLRSIEEVKEDMERPRPMDRLLCGDVGFGKTEVALRAAFKAVMDSKQVAYLCPTTILAMQHYNTFVSRMRDFPIKIEMLSRFRTPAQQAQTIERLKNGETDIVIGTHRILQKDVGFRDLGLLVVDEEQRFGVTHKERLKELKKNVDVLTMTATPIPRTLHMSMISVRDMSLLTKPPENRYPVETFVLEDDPSVIITAIKNELARGGQVFYLYNRVSGIYHKAEWIKAMIPEANVAVGHGKMSRNELEDIMYDVVNGDTDVLVCTTIIETGLDIPNANTIIIENADRMGLAQLYQLRGRVGRSNRTAYAYLTYRRDGILSEVAQKRLKAVKEFTEFGSGFKIALRDLEIRGAGNILGAEQHGHMDSVGYDMYCKILEESVLEAQGKKPKEDIDVSVDLGINAYIPESYISDANVRIEMYKKIASIENDEDKADIEDELTDRFGEMPRTAANVIEIGALRAKAKRCGVFELSVKGAFVRLKLTKEAADMQMVIELDKHTGGRIKLIPSEKPVINYSIRQKANILAEVRDILDFMEVYLSGE